MSSEIVLIGPFKAGKSTVAQVLSEMLGLPQVSLDELRWDYYREIGYDDSLAKEIRARAGFLALALYWSLFNSHAIMRVLADHQDCVFDLGAGPIIFENVELAQRIERELAPYPNVVRLMPSPDAEESIRILSERARALPGTTAQGFDWSRFFVEHPGNRALAKHTVYTAGKTFLEIGEEIAYLPAAGSDGRD